MGAIKAIIVLVIIYAIFLFSGYGVTVGSSENAAGLGLLGDILHSLVISPPTAAKSGLFLASALPSIQRNGKIRAR